jgi:acyl-CoA thioesterase
MPDRPSIVPTEMTIPTTPGVADFVADTAVVADPVHPGRYRAHIADGWKVIYAFGGVSMAVTVRAIQELIGRPDLDLLSAHAVFCRPVPCGEVTVDASLMRSGRSAVQGRAELMVAGTDEIALHATATYGRHGDSPISYLDLEIPSAAGLPGDHEPPPPRADDDPFPAVAFHDQTDWRPAIGTRWWDDEPEWSPGPARSGSWMRLVREPRRKDGSFDPLALLVPADTVGSAIGQHLGPDRDDHFFTVTLELDVQFFSSPATPWVFQDLRAPHADGGYAYGSVNLFDEEGQLVAVASQRALLRHFEPGDGFFA